MAIHPGVRARFWDREGFNELMIDWKNSFDNIFQRLSMSSETEHDFGPCRTDQVLYAFFGIRRIERQDYSASAAISQSEVVAVDSRDIF